MLGHENFNPVVKSEETRATLTIADQRIKEITRGGSAGRRVHNLSGMSGNAYAFVGRRLSQQSTSTSISSPVVRAVLHYPADSFGVSKSQNAAISPVVAAPRRSSADRQANRQNPLG